MKSFGYVMGLLVGLVIAAILLKYGNTNHRYKTQYDERQKEYRGRAYQYGFYTLLIFEVLLMIPEFGEITLPIPGYILHFAGCTVGILVVTSYCIWKDVYWGLNNNRKRYGLIFLACGILNAIPVIGAITHGGLIRDGKLESPAINLFVLIMMVVISAELLVKASLDKKEAEE